MVFARSVVRYSASGRTKGVCEAPILFTICSPVKLKSHLQIDSDTYQAWLLRWVSESNRPGRTMPPLRRWPGLRSAYAGGLPSLGVGSSSPGRKNRAGSVSVSSRRGNAERHRRLDGHDLFLRSRYAPKGGRRAGLRESQSRSAKKAASGKGKPLIAAPGWGDNLW
jgi:hypothetical protein